MESESKSQQPMSLMTIDANNLDGRKQAQHPSGAPISEGAPDLLTLRILEASERKMQLIRQLLTPEQYSSLSSDFFTTQRDFLYSTQSLSQADRLGRSLGSRLDSEQHIDFPLKKQTNSVPSGLAGSQDKLFRDRRAVAFHKDVSDQRPSKVPEWKPKMALNLQENLEKKRRAIEFFFSDHERQKTAVSQQADKSLAIELRFAHYRNQDPQSELKFLATPSQLTFVLGLLVSVWHLFVRLCRCDLFTSEASNQSAVLSDGEDADKRYICRYKKVSCLPYVRENNLLMMRDRLIADAHLERVSSLSTPLPNTQTLKGTITITKRSQLKKIDLSKHRAQQIIINQLEGPSMRVMVPGRRRCRDPQIVVHHPIVGYVCGSTSDTVESFSAEKPSSLKVQVRSIKLMSCPLMSEEEKLCGKLEELYDDYERELKRLDRLRSGLSKFASERLLSEVSALADFKKYTKISEVEGRLVELVLSKQQSLGETWSQIESTRSQQRFNSTQKRLTGTEVDESTKILSIRLLESVQEVLTRRFGPLDDLDAREMSELGEIQSQLRHQTSRRKELDNLLKNCIISSDLPVTRDDELPLRERDRRDKFLSWLNSLRLRISFEDGRVLQQIRPFDSTTFEASAATREEILMQGCQVALPTSLPHPIKLIFDLVSSRPENTNLILKRSKPKVRVEASAHLVINPAEMGGTSIQLKGQSDDEAERVLAFINLDDALARTTDSRQSMEAAMKRLDESFFSANLMRSDLNDVHAKMSRLINRVDSSLLARLLASSRERPYCVLDPFESEFCERRLDSTRPFQPSIRVALIAWRWLVNERHQMRIYLSDRENVNLLENVFDAQTLKIKLDKRLDQPKVVGHKFIELTRVKAMERISQIEQLIEHRLEAQRLESGALLAKEVGVRSDQLKDILVEPKLETNIDLRQLARTLRVLLPRRTARRPLMPDRRGRWRRRQDTKLGQLVELSQQQRMGRVGEEAGIDGQSTDIEHGAFSRWRSNAFNQVRSNGDNLRLLVTIQQAYNVPLRLIPALGYPMNQLRPSSPLFPQSPSMSSFGTNRLISSPLFGQQQAYLAAPTSYVEVIFQRKQLTSSLAQSESPAWNETLFFTVDSSASASSSGGPFGHLVDESLQVNLYDCRCYVQEPEHAEFSSMSASQMSTMLLGNETLSLNLHASSLNLAANTPSRLVSTQRQRIERHLIGSLRLPLAVLLSNGRIEGSFALNQPLLLDNYQFESNSTRKTQLSLFITLDPPVLVPLHIYLPLDSIESRALFCYARLWEQLISSKRLLKPNSSRSRRRDNLSRQPMDAASSKPLELDVRRLQATSSAHSSRHVRALTLGQDGRYRLLCRYLGPLEPPPIGRESGRGDDELDTRMRRLARFVSLLSPMKHGLFKMRLLASNIWFDSVHLLADSLGSHEEKAVLLCNYFQYLGKCSALLLGDAIPEGRCVYVVVWSEQLKRDTDRLEAQLSDLLENLADGEQPSISEVKTEPINQENFVANLPILINSKSVQIWDPNSGLGHKLNDPSLQLISVGSIVTCENIYANIQPKDAPSELSYDIRQRNLWFPLLDQISERRTTNTPGASIESLLKRDQRRISQMNLRRQLNYLQQLAKQVGHASIEPILSPTTRINYSTLTSTQCADLKTAIEQSIKAHLLTWRPDRPTYFNRTLSRVLVERLATFEQTYFLQEEREQESALSPDSNEERGISFSDWHADLEYQIRNEVLNMSSQLKSSSLASGLASPFASQMQDRQVISWPVNLTYTNMQAILDGLFASGVHNADLLLDSTTSNRTDSASSPTQHLSTQFLVACHVEAYPARVMSVWLYVGAIVVDPNANKFNNILL